MPKATEPVDQTSPGDDITLTEFCLRLSSTDKRVELIGGFERRARSAGQVKAAESTFAAQFADFLNQPA